MVDLLENCCLYPTLDIAIDARAAYDVVPAIGACEPHGRSIKFHISPARDRLILGIIRKTHWVDIRDILAGGFTKGGIDRTLHNVSNFSPFELAHAAFSHSNVGAITRQQDVAEVERP